MISYCEMPEFYADSEIVAKKLHHCSECSAPIEKGERYLYCRGKWDGEFSVYKQHILCWKACLHIRDEQDGECIPFGGLMQWRRDTGYFVPPGHAARSKPEAVQWRAMMAKILWRERKHRIKRKRRDGVLLKRGWGGSWASDSEAQPSFQENSGA